MSTAVLLSQRCHISIEQEAQMTGDQFYAALIPVAVNSYTPVEQSFILRIDYLSCDFGTDIIVMHTSSGHYFFKELNDLYNRWISANNAGSFFQQELKGNEVYQDPAYYPLLRCRGQTSNDRCKRLTRDDFCWQH